MEFPEVFHDGGFDAICGNPPFIFGKNITIGLGKSYNDYLKNNATNATNNVNICCYFALRSFSISKYFGIIATTTITEGESRGVSLEQILCDGGIIYEAVSKMKWPGSAAVYISFIFVTKEKWIGKCILNNKQVKEISSFLTENITNELYPLKSNKDKAMVGVIPNGDGLFLSQTEYDALIRNNPHNKEVLLPYVTGADLNAPSFAEKRYIINFWNWSFAKAQEFPEVLAIVEDRVKPHRQTLSKLKEKVKKSWWLFEATAKKLFYALGYGYKFDSTIPFSSETEQKVITIARVSKTGAFSFQPKRTCFAAEVVVILSDSFGIFATLQSSLHISFAWHHAGKMKTDLRYSPTMCFETFPFPSEILPSLKSLGQCYDTLRREIMNRDQIGLTKLYNAFHNPDTHDAEIEELRQLQKQIDEAVRDSYGWSDVALDHDFHAVSYLPENDNIRYTISEPARIEILCRLAILNKQRWQEEQNGKA